MNKYFYILISLLAFNISSYAQGFTGINTRTPNTHTFLHISEGTGASFKAGLITTRYNATERNANLNNLVAADNGLLIFNRTDNCFNYWNGATSSWVKMLTPFYFTPNNSATILSPSSIGSAPVTGGTITLPVAITIAGTINAINTKLNGITFTMAATPVTKTTTSITINFSGTRTNVTNIYLPIKDNEGLILCYVFVPVQ